MSFEKPKLDGLSDLEGKLYSPSAKFDVRPRHVLKAKKPGVAASWGAPGETVSADEFVASLQRKPKSPFVKIFLVALGFFALAAGYGLWKLGPGAPGVEEGSEDIRLSVVGPSTAQGGEEYAFDVVIQNLSETDIRLADLVVEMPPGTRDAATRHEDLDRLRIPIGDVAAGETVRQAVAIALFGDEGESREFQIRLEYRAPNSATIFEKDRPYQVSLAAAPVLLTVDALSEITPGQPLTFTAKVTSNSSAPLGPVGLQVQIPFGFTTNEVSEAPRETNLWVFEKLNPGETREVKITGTLDGAHGDDRIFRFSVGALGSATSTEVSVPYSQRSVQVAVSRPFLDLQLEVNGQVGTYVVSSSQSRVSARLAVVNNTSGPIRDATVEMKLNGSALDERSVSASDGIYRSADNIMRWDRTTNPLLEEIDAGQTVWLGFGFQSEPLASGGTVFSSPEIVVDAEANGRRVFDENVPEQLVANLISRIKILTDVEVSAGAVWRSGPNPPQVDRASTYRISWEVTNTSSDIELPTVSATLPPLLEWVGNASAEDVTYDPASRLVTWRLTALAAGTGFGKPSRRASFDVTLVPSVTYEGEVVPLLGKTTFLGKDAFAGADVTATRKEFATDILDGTDGKVIPAVN